MDGPSYATVEVIPSENIYLYISLLTKPSDSEKMDRSIIAGDMAVQGDVTGNKARDFNYITPPLSLSVLSLFHPIVLKQLGR
jgi:hypothetical protein